MASSLNGTGLTFSSGSTLNSPPVTSVATGNGLSGGTITTTGTLAIAAPTALSVGAYCWGQVSNYSSGADITLTSGGSYAPGTGNGQIQNLYTYQDSCGRSTWYANTLSGTWRWMGPTTSRGGAFTIGGLFCRVA
jgi:hypothetical protein